ncbi:MAG TPA: YdeI/OmpD-associated family protein [bacterium]
MPKEPKELGPSRLLEVVTRRAWRAWLKAHAGTASETWLVFWKKHTGHATLVYNDAVEEALCFGWIDSTVRRLDDDRYAQRFTPRRPGRPYSQANKERLRYLAAKGLVAPAVLATLDFLDEKDFPIAADILAALKAEPAAWRNFQRFPPAYVRIRVGFVEGARRRPQEFAKRLRHFVRMTKENRRFGFGGIEKHYDRS